MKPNRADRAAQAQKGIVLLVVMVFLLISSLLALADVRSLMSQERLVANAYDRAKQLAYVDTALSKQEVQARAQAPGNPPINSSFPASQPNGGVNGSTNFGPCLSLVSDNSPCNAGYCSEPTVGCRVRWSDPNFGNWANQSFSAETPFSLNNNSISTTFNYQSLIEYLGVQSCVAGVSNPSCPVYRVTVRNRPANPLNAQVTLQSTYLVNNGVGQRLSWREVLPD
jgi:Tfp pilus assembly protein PilX